MPSQLLRHSCFANRWRLSALLCGCAATWFVGCGTDQRAPQPSTGAPGSAGRDNKAGQAGKGTTAAGEGSVGEPGGAGGRDSSGAAGASASAGGPGVEGPPGVGGDPGLMLEPCPSDDAAPPPSFAGVCSTAQAWATGTEVVLRGADKAPSLLAVTPDELTLLWSEAGSSVPAYFLADREVVANAFDSAQELPFAGVLGVSPDGLRLTLSDAGRLTEAVRQERGQNFAEPEPGAYATLNADANAKHLSLGDAVLSPDQKTLLYTAWSSNQLTTYPLLVSTRAGSEPWPVGVALQSCEFKAYGARGPRPSALSSDGLTLFYLDDARASTRVAFRTSKSADFSWFTELPGRLTPQPNTSCDKLYFSPTSNAAGLLAAARKP